jgi:uncharacterized membrane protein YbhN (UPF0104 family)
MATIRSLRGGWFMLAFAAYGFLFFPAAWRWHLTLRLAKCGVSRGTTVRFTFVGHFFYTILFGAAGGDFAKSGLYARWNNFPLPKILAAASLDRLLGFGGLILFTGLAFALTAMHGELIVANSISWRLPKIGFALIALAVVVLIFIIRRFWQNTGWRRFAHAFSENGHRLLAAPNTLLLGLVWGFLVQLALSGTLALNLCAVSREPVPWMKLIWTLPLISIVSALPITIAGMGVRESAALGLLGLCGVSGTQAVAASMLTASVSLLWAMIGGVLFWYETNHRNAQSEIQPPAATIVKGQT